MIVSYDLEEINKSSSLVLQKIDLQWFSKAEDEGRTEDASEHKLKKAREEGRVAKSQELNAALVLVLSIVVLFISGAWVCKNCIEAIEFFFTRCTETSAVNGNMAGAFFSYFLKMILPISLTAFVAAIVGNIIQNRGFLFSTKPITPKFSKILPKFGEYFRKTLFSPEGAFNVVKSIVKVAVIVVVAFIIIKNDLQKLLSLIDVSNLWQGVCYVAGMTLKLLFFAAGIFLIISIPDYIIQRRQFLESLKMTKQEVKEEFKELEGDPLVKSRLKQRMHEMMHQNMPKLVAEADVIITNPTHFACAIQYDRETMPGPMLTAKGADSLAFRMREIAKENNVPIVENRPLARALYAEVEIGDIIPETFYNALAQILAKVYTMNSNKNKLKYTK